MIVKFLKSSLFRILVFTFLGSIAVSVLVTANTFKDFESELDRRLESKKFINPTEFYAAPMSFIKDKFFQKEKVLENLKKQNFRERRMDQRLLPGDFSLGIKAECETQLGTLVIAYTDCLSWVNKTVKATSADKEIYWILFNSENFILEVLQGLPPHTVPEVDMEPELFAQYISSDPIMQEEFTISEVPTYCPNAVMAIEDAKFLEHSGYSIKGTLRGVVMPLLRGKRPQGGSTITQQLVKNYFLTNERSAKRKIHELILSVLIEKKLTKDQILETYLNIIYMGQNGPFQLIGFGAASRYYFQKKLTDIGLAECALLAAILNGPSVYNPFTKVEKTLQRRNLVLAKMKELNLISEEEYESALKISLPLKKTNLASETAPYYIDAVRKEMRELGLPLEGSKIYTGLNLNQQYLAQEALRNHLERLENENKKIIGHKKNGHLLEGVVLASNNKTGLISVAVGGRSYKMTQFNRAVDSHRQVGSIFKPIVYLTALTHKNQEGKYYHPLTIINDEKFEVKYEKQKWKPENYTKKFFGPVPMYFALKNSLNAATAKLGIDIGLGEIINTAKTLGVKSELKSFPSLTLGAFEMFPIEVLQVYTTLANLGKFMKVSFISKVLDQNNKSLYEKQKEKESKPVFSDVAISSLLSMMKQTTQTGTAKQIGQSGYDYPVAGKTGTTSDFKDSWFAGITPFMSTIVWVGYDQNLVTGLTGGSGAVPVWIDFMKSASVNFNKKDFLFPEDKIKRISIDAEFLQKMNINNINIIYKDLEPDLKPFELIFDKENTENGI